MISRLCYRAFNNTNHGPDGSLEVAKSTLFLVELIWSTSKDGLPSQDCFDFTIWYVQAMTTVAEGDKTNAGALFDTKDCGRLSGLSDPAKSEGVALCELWETATTPVGVGSSITETNNPGAD